MISTTASDALQIGTFIGMVFVGIYSKIQAWKSKQRSSASTAAVNGVKEDVANVQKQADAVHSLVNSAMTAQLRLTATALRRIAILTKDPSDAALAEEAETILAASIARQSQAEANFPSPSN
jgi:hypothetical protein